VVTAIVPVVAPEGTVAVIFEALLTLKTAEVPWKATLVAPVKSVPVRGIIAPTLIIHAADDPAPPIEGAREVAERIPGSRLVTLDGGHLLLGHAQEIQRLTGDFIAGNQ
jgi:pimeloyl-ACP methyl ester carboxylesterase